MRTQLYSHNKTAYQKVMAALETSDRTCVVHPTGTGKSYLIAAVSENFKKVLILGPNIFVLDQVHDVLRWRRRGVEYMTYQTLMLTDSPHTDYDLICLDEFHRAGAQEWGAAVDRMLEANQTAKVFGTTATPIRYLDGERNMADELFHGNIASNITIAEAWNRNILPIPRYVSGLFRWDKAVSDTEERISKSRSLTEDAKRKRIFRLTNEHLHWELSYGMPSILRKHLDKDARRVIVFCGNIESLEQMRKEVVGWFREAGFTIACTCLMHSLLPDSEQRSQMQQFESEKDEGLRLMFSVNMLNEGIHVPNVNAVLMLRTTSSRIIYMQQMGRCLTTANTAKPLVLDMVDNITTTTAIKDLQDEFDAIEIPQAEREGREPRRFEVMDYTLGVRQMIEKLVPKEHVIVPYEYRLKRFLDFVAEKDRLPLSTTKQEHEEYLNFLNLLNASKTNPDPRFMDVYRKYRPQKENDEQLLQRFLDFVTENHRLPNFCDKPTPYERNLYYLVRLRLKDHPRVKELWEEYAKSPRIPFDERLQRLVSFVNEHHRVPGKSDKKDYNNYGVLLQSDEGKENDTLNRIIARYGKVFKDVHVKIKVLDFYAEHGRLPGAANDATRNERTLYNLFMKRKDSLFTDPDIAPLLEGRTEKVKKDEKIRMVKEFCEAHDRKPVPHDGRIFKIWEALSTYAKDPRVIALRQQYATKKLSPEQKILAMQEYTVRHGQRPPTSDKKNYAIWDTMLQLRKDDPRVMDMRRKYAKNTTLDDQIEAIQHYIAEHGMRPAKDAGGLYLTWNKLVRNHIGDPRVKALYEQYGVKRIPYEERVRMIQEFTAANDRCPKPAEKELYGIWKRLIENKCNDPRVQEMYDKYGGRLNITTPEEKIAVMQQFTAEHGRCPKSSEGKMYNIWRHMIHEQKEDPRVQELREKYCKKYSKED